MIRTKNVCLAALFVVLLVSMTPASAADVSVGVDVNSAYVWRGTTLNDGLVVQPSLLLAKGGLEVFFWGNINIDDYDETLETDELSEIDIDISYGRELMGIDVRIGVVEYLYPNDGSLVSTGGVAAVEGTGEVYASLSRDIVGGLSLAFLAYYDFDEVKDGYGKLTLSYEGIVGEALLLTAGASIGIAGRDTTETGEDGLHEYEVFANAVYAFGSGVGLSGHIAFTDTADEDVLAEQDTDIYGGVGIKYLF